MKLWFQTREKVFYEFADLHTHVIPFVDDGADTTDTALHMLAQAYQGGTRILAATPHYHPGKGMGLDTEWILKQFEQLQQLAALRWPDLALYLGSEIYYDNQVTALLEMGMALTMNHTRTILLEFMPFQTFSSIRNAICQIQGLGYQIILAHAERYLCLLEELDHVRSLHKMGILIQINAHSITGANGRTTSRFAGRCLKEHLVDIVSSDAHDTRFRTTDLQAASRLVARRYGREYERRIFWETGKQLLLMTKDKVD